MGKETIDAFELIRNFVNTLDVETGRDSLRSREARRIREAIRDLLLANNGVPTDVTRASRVLDGAARRASVTVRFGDGHVRAEGRGAVGRILAALALAMMSEDWPRLKACRSGTCRYAFVDRARNRSRAWCSMSVCGNREKAQRFRERHAA